MSFYAIDQRSDTSCSPSVSSRRYMLVSYPYDLESARKLMTELRFPAIKGAVCRVLPFDKDLKVRKFDTKSSLFIKNLPKAWTHKELYDFFKPFGDITSAKVSINENHSSRGYGFVQFSREEFALRAISEVSQVSAGFLNENSMRFKVLNDCIVQWESGRGGQQGLDDRQVRKARPETEQRQELQQSVCEAVPSTRLQQRRSTCKEAYSFYSLSIFLSNSHTL